MSNPCASRSRAAPDHRRHVAAAAVLDHVIASDTKLQHLGDIADDLIDSGRPDALLLAASPVGWPQASVHRIGDLLNRLVAAGEASATAFAIAHLDDRDENDHVANAMAGHAPCVGDGFAQLVSGWGKAPACDGRAMDEVRAVQRLAIRGRLQEQAAHIGAGGTAGITRPQRRMSGYAGWHADAPCCPHPPGMRVEPLPVREPGGSYFRISSQVSRALS